MALKLQDVPRQNEHAASREIGGLIYIVDPDSGELHSLNEVATRIWMLIDGARTVSGIIDAIVDDLEVERSVASEDTLGLLAALQSKGLVGS